MIPLLAALVALACAAASARRIWFATNPTALEPETLLASLQAHGPDGAASPVARLHALVEAVPSADWERDLIEAMSVRSREHRAALVNEQLTELDFRLQRWARVPRVCASIATSFGFLLATLVLRRGLANTENFSPDAAELFVHGLVGDALSVAAFGLVGTAFCVAAAGQAKAFVARRAQAADRLVDWLERSIEADAEAAPTAATAAMDGTAIDDSVNPTPDGGAPSGEPTAR